MTRKQAMNRQREGKGLRMGCGNFKVRRIAGDYKPDATVLSSSKVDAQKELSKPQGYLIVVAMMKRFCLAEGARRRLFEMGLWHRHPRVRRARVLMRLAQGATQDASRQRIRGASNKRYRIN